MKRIYPDDFPTQKECRIDKINIPSGSPVFLLVDFRDESVIFIASFPDRTLSEIYKSCQYFIKSNIGIDTWIPYSAGRNFKRFDNILYK